MYYLVPKEVDTMHVTAAAASEVAGVAANGDNHGESSDDSDLGDMEEEDEEEDEEIPLDMEVLNITTFNQSSMGL